MNGTNCSMPVRGEQQRRHRDQAAARRSAILFAAWILDFTQLVLKAKGYRTTRRSSVTTTTVRTDLHHQAPSLLLVLFG
jgi:hypothetical protein